MTFQQAFDNIINHEKRTYHDIKQSLKTIEWYADNILELEDYETDKMIYIQSYIVRNKITL